jgi:hypothetical protein
MQPVSVDSSGPVDVFTAAVEGLKEEMAAGLTGDSDESNEPNESCDSCQ